MSSILVTNIKLLVNTIKENKLLRGKDLAYIPCIGDAYLIISDGIITEFGEMASFERHMSDFAHTIDASGKMIIPAWCDSHTHLVFAKSREDEFIDKIKGLTYAEIAERGGGILNSARNLNKMPEDELFNLAWKRLKDVSKLGTGAIEIKSGYGLTFEGELKMLRVIKRLKEKSNLSIKATFLGAHTYPLEYRDNHLGYINSIITEMLPVIAKEKLADYIDVFCETVFFLPKKQKRYVVQE